MINLFISNPKIYSLFILPLFVFLARILDVSLGTIRIIFISKGYKYLAPVIGFFEISIWLLAVTQIFQNLKSPVYYLAYAGGFATGTLAGILIENKLSIGMVLIRVITQKDSEELIKILKLKDYNPTRSYAEGPDEQQVSVIYMILDRHDVLEIIDIIKNYNPNAFYSVGDVKFVSNKILPHTKLWYKRYDKSLLRNHRKGK